ncbi:MAG: MFS transporter [Planctomycetota bacterium]
MTPRTHIEVPDDELPRGVERLALGSLAAAAFVLNLNTLVLGALLPFLPTELVRPGSGEKTLLAAAALASGIGALLVGPLADRLGRKRMLVVGMFVFAAASAMHAFADSYELLLAARIVSGAAVGVAYACASALAAEIVPYARRGAAMGQFTAGMFLALPLGLPLAWWFASRGEWQTIFWVQAAIGFAGAWVAKACVPERTGGGRWVDPRDVLREVPVLGALLAMMLHNGSFFTTVQLSSRWLDQEALVHKDQQGWVWVWLGLCAAVGSFAFGRVADRVGKRNFVMLTSTLLVACFVLLARVHTLSLLLPLGIALAVVSSARTGPLQAMTSGLVPSYQLATLMGLRAFVMQLGVFVFAWLVPTDGEGWFEVVLYTAAACQLASYLAIRFFVREGNS